tara:strand:- start:190 stop:366 length:177 start_codon:yes stop_codon:yes gene_type:complete
MYPIVVKPIKIGAEVGNTTVMGIPNTDIIEAKADVTAVETTILNPKNVNLFLFLTGSA